MRRVYRRLFIRFLKEEKIYYPFRRNVVNINVLKKHLRNVKKENAIYDAFIWRNTIEGQDFWAIMNSRWHSFLGKNKGIKILFFKYWNL